MSGKVFVDTNILVYEHIADESQKHKTACDLLTKKLINQNVFVSTQVIGEFYAVMVKYKRKHEEISGYLTELIHNTNVAGISLATVELCLKLKGIYGYSYWDSLILAAALEIGCDVVCSEDMQHNQLIEGALRIMNPFACE